MKTKLRNGLRKPVLWELLRSWDWVNANQIHINRILNIFLRYENIRRLWMNEWWPFIPIHTDICGRAGKKLHWSVMLLTKITRILFECMYMFNDGLYNCWISLITYITFIKRLDPKIVLSLIRQIMRLMNKVPPQSTKTTKSEHVVGQCSAPLLTHQNWGFKQNAVIPARQKLCYYNQCQYISGGILK